MTSIDFVALMKAEKQKYKRKENESASSAFTLPPPAPVAAEVVGVDAGNDDLLCPPPMRTLTLRSFQEDPEDYRLKTCLCEGGSLDAPPSLFYIPDFIAAEDEEWLMSQIYSRASLSHWVKLQTRRLQCYRVDERSNRPPAQNNTHVAAGSGDVGSGSSNSRGGGGGGGGGGGPAGETPFPPYLSHFIDTINANPFIKETRSKCIEAAAAGCVADWGLPSPPPSQGEGDADADAIRKGCGVDMNHVLVNEYQPGQGIMHHTDGPRYTPFVLIISLESSVLMTFKRRLQSHEIGSGGAGVDAPVFCVVLEPRSAFIFSNEAYSCFLHGIDDTLCDVFDDHVLSSCINKHLCKGLPVVGGGSHSGAAVPRKTRISLTIRHAL